MSIFGSMTTAVLGLTAQSRALGHISDNIANAQTIGYKRVNTAFQTLVLESNSRLHAPGGVSVTPVFMNNIQGNLTQVQSPTNIAIQGQGFFSVSKLDNSNNTNNGGGGAVQTQTGTVAAKSTYYSRQGDFELDKNRYLVNSSGYALNGWLVDAVTGELKKDTVQPIQVNTLIDKPDATTRIELSANLPATPKPGEKIPTSSIQIFDTQGNPRTVNMNWRQQGANSWRLSIDAPGSSAKPVDGTFGGYPATISFGQNIDGVTPVAQVNTVTVTGQTTNNQNTLRVGETYTITVDDTAYSIKLTSDNIGNIRTFSGLAGALANQINSASPAAPVMATVNGGVIALTAREAGVPFKVKQSVESVTPTNNTVTGPTTTAATSTAGKIDKFTFPQSQIDIGDVFTVNITTGTPATTTPVSVTVTAANYSTFENITGVTQELANRINSRGLGMTASSAGGVLSIQGNAPATTFTTAAGVSNAASAANSLTGAFSVANVAPVYQRQTVTLTGTPGDVGTLYSLSVNGTPVTYTTTGDEMSMEDITAALANKINTNTSLPVTASAQGGVINIIAKKPVSPASDHSLTVGGPVGNNTVTWGGSNTIDVGDVFSITTPTNTYSLTITNANRNTYGTPDSVLNQLRSQINAAEGPAVNATLTSTGVLTVTGAGAAITATVTNVAAEQFTLQQTAVVGQTPAHIGLTFGTTPETVGTLTKISTALVGTGTAVSSATQSAGKDAAITFTVNYGFGPQQVVLSMGQFQKPGGLTQYAGDTMNVTQLVQNGAPRGQFKDIVFGGQGEVVVNFDNGRSKTVAQVPIITFNNPNGLQREAGGVYIETDVSGKPNFNDPESNGAGAVIANSVEGSNVDIADEFTKLIVTQRTYSANTKIVTTSDEMLQEVLGLKR